MRELKELVDFEFVYQEVREKYWIQGNVSVPPPVILKLMLLLIFYNVRSGINNPRRFKAYWDSYRDGPKVKAWIPMRKGVADVYRRVEVSRATNARYLEALKMGQVHA